MIELEIATAGYDLSGLDLSKINEITEDKYCEIMDGFGELRDPVVFLLQTKLESRRVEWMKLDGQLHLWKVEALENEGGAAIDLMSADWTDAPCTYLITESNEAAKQFALELMDETYIFNK